MPLLEIRSLSKSIGPAEILRDINLSVERGEILGLIGPTGSGKTTLLRLVNLLDESSSGSILFDGSLISGRPEREKLAVRRKMAMVFQKPVMFKARVEENVSFGLKMRGRDDAEEMRGRVKEALAAVGLSGYESRDANTLSGGETQRIALARAIILQPELLLLDEPTANLDPRSAASIDSLLQSLAGGSTAVILATHNMQQCRKLADRVAVLQAGRLTAQGKSEEIFGPEEKSKVSGPHACGITLPW
ncbi:MAG: phosphate ABC transporter ATP-binding protein [Methanotrichaceae archaeon]|nr:phosphate ABC transporter ATP-binding protein [Methanotrichaceae archaeon]